MTDSKTNESARTAVQRYLAAWNGEGWGESGQDMMSLMRDIFDPSFDYVEDPAIAPTRVSGMDEYAMALEIRVNREAFPDLLLEFDPANILVEDDRAVAWWAARGTYQQPARLVLGLPGAQYSEVDPTGKEYTAQGVTIAVVKEGRMTALETIWSPRSLLQQVVARAQSEMSES